MWPAWRSFANKRRFPVQKCKHKATRAILMQLLDKEDSDTREFAPDSLLELYGNDIEQTLKDYKDDAIQTSINDWRDTNNCRQLWVWCNGG